MTADCQACLVGVPQIKTPAGKPDDPIGACVKCGSLTCGQHGYRAPKPAFLCIQCDSALQAGSAGWKDWRKRIRSGATSQTPGSRAAAGETAADALRALLPEGWGSLVSSFEEWAEQRPYYRLLIELIRQDLDNMVYRLDRAAEKPLGQVSSADGAAATGRISPESFAAFWRQLDRDSKRLLAAALVLAQVMNLPLWSLPPPLQSIAEIAAVPFRSDFPKPGMEIPFEESRYR